MLLPSSRAHRICLTALVWLSLAGPALAQGPENPTPAPATTVATAPVVTFGVLSFLQYSAALHEQDGFNAFDVTRGYFDVHARLSPRLRARFTPKSEWPSRLRE